MTISDRRATHTKEGLCKHNLLTGSRRNPSWRLGLLALFHRPADFGGAATSCLGRRLHCDQARRHQRRRLQCGLFAAAKAIIAANAAPGAADVITLPAGTYTLSRTGVDNSAANGDLDVTGR
ncbi:MAG: hypothetical protein R3E79_46790 [Caldilineaceae bacterium]